VINVAKYYFKKHGLIVNPLNEILITPGGKKNNKKI
jgi:aspartate/methionine/tyrosine aminotransferase